MDNNPFVEDNSGLDEVLIGASDRADESVQQILQQTEQNISKSISANMSLADDQDLIFQPSSAPQVTTGGSIDGGNSFNDRSNLLSSGTNPGSSNEDLESPTASSYFKRCCGCFSVDYYKPYFNVDTNDVVERLKRVFMPWKDDFFQEVDANPDLYSPFWICTTLILITSVSAGLAKYFSSNQTEDMTYKSDIKTLTVATSFVYGFAVAMPAAAYFVLSRLEVGGKLEVVELICVYGYSLAAFIPSSLGCIIPVDGLDWVFVLAGFGFSSAFLLRNLWIRLQAQGSSIADITTDTNSGEGRKKIATLLIGLIAYIFALPLV
eukprot:CAMPEP_0184036796 /NCGR_PEP_ID=MMETSP0955-20130417/34711_1 /TAXON_ID=627963 /ORGANISM="Aplanochytrium sp, Strain PBS07" /LENGTH=320 /DNA_ID=CAMNT_0026324597 /DNA_START=95 /DNA_END=1058 /DNA_ORIENTATION=-